MPSSGVAGCGLFFRLQALLDVRFCAGGLALLRFIGLRLILGAKRLDDQDSEECG